MKFARKILRHSIPITLLILYGSTAFGFADSYLVTIRETSPRLAHVNASVTPDGREIRMNEEGVHGLKNGWATFVENIKATDKYGRPYDVIEKNDSRWELKDYKSGNIKLSYDVRLGHDQVDIKFGDNGAAYRTPDGVMWAGRALFIVGKPARDISVRFELPKSWKVTTPWEQIRSVNHKFRVRGTKDLVNSAFFAGNHFESNLSSGQVTLRLALSGKNARGMRGLIEAGAKRYLDYYGRVFRSKTKASMLMIASDRSYWGGEVMGRAISLSIGGKPPEGVNPLSVLSHVIAHEIFHIFSLQRIEIGNEDANSPSLQWFYEGFSAEYAAWLVRLRLGEISEEAFLAELVNQQEKYKAKLEGVLTLVSAGKDKSENYDLVYSGGFVAAISLDFLIRSETNGKKSLDDLWIYLLKRFPTGGEPLTKSKVSKAIKEVYGNSVSKAFEGYINSPDEIPFFKNAELLGLVRKGGKLILDPNATENQKSLWRDFIRNSNL